MEHLRKGPAHEGDDLNDFFSSSSSSGISSGSSLESDSFEEVTSHSSSSDQLAAEPLSDMSSLFQHLPIKRGLSRHYQGKSQSFTSLANVRSLEDLAKPENPYNKKMKSCRSYGGGLCSPNTFSRQICKRASLHSGSRSSCSSLSAKRNSASNFMASRPPIPPHRSPTTISNQTALYA